MSAKKKELTISALKKQLEGLERKELERLLCELYKSNEAAGQSLPICLGISTRRFIMLFAVPFMMWRQQRQRMKGYF